MRIVRIPLTIGSYSDGVVDLTWAPEKHARVAVIGLSVDKLAALRDHEAVYLKHGGLNAITGMDVSGTMKYPALGHVASFFNPDLGAGQSSIVPVADLTENETAIGGTQDQNVASLTTAWDGSTYPTAAEGALLIDGIRESMAGVNALNTFVEVLESNQQALALALQLMGRDTFKPWPGRLNDPADWQRLLYKIQQNQPLTGHEALRLKFARAVPCEGFAAWHVTPNVDFKVRLQRIHGSTSITRAYLWAIDYTDEVNPDELHGMICAMPDLTDYPHWMVAAGNLTAGAAVQTPIEPNWINSEIAPHALRIRALLAMAHSNASGTITYGVSYLQNLLLSIKEAGKKDIYPTYANQRQPLEAQAVQYLQQLDCWRRFDYLLRWNTELQITPETLAATSNTRDLRLSFYGLLRPQSEGGNVADRS
jgi:hypothetical protein